MNIFLLIFSKIRNTIQKLKEVLKISYEIGLIMKFNKIIFPNIILPINFILNQIMKMEKLDFENFLLHPNFNYCLNADPELFKSHRVKVKARHLTSYIYFQKQFKELEIEHFSTQTIMSYKFGKLVHTNSGLRSLTAPGISKPCKTSLTLNFGALYKTNFSIGGLFFMYAYTRLFFGKRGIGKLSGITGLWLVLVKFVQFIKQIKKSVISVFFIVSFSHCITPVLDVKAVQNALQGLAAFPACLVIPWSVRIHFSPFDRQSLPKYGILN
ncbi:hypothetical protein BpHYR1_006628 [Brachionus plicatilis]|uniref:Uncharacterized protein n=1 Tax=Brachionus plicatilis TaxID=10195 RepID=A0A3M7SEV0_BRAPC|nr:hypothetical protein BpHYR1_006628 [Brachionus plicatilis]